MLHYGQAEQVLRQRQATLTAAYKAHPERFIRGAPKSSRLPETVWIYPPKTIEPTANPLNVAFTGKARLASSATVNRATATDTGCVLNGRIVL